MYLEIVELGMPVVLELLDLGVYSACLLVGSDDLCSLCAVLLTNEEYYLDSSACAQLNSCLESAACIAVVVEDVVASAAFNSDRISICCVGADEVVQ